MMGFLAVSTGSALQRKVGAVALLLSVLFILLLLYNGARLLLSSELEPVMLAQDALLPAEIFAASDDVSAQGLIDRPLFWNTRRALKSTGQAGVAAAARPKAANVAVLENVTLMGVYNSGGVGGIIVQVDGNTQRIPINQKVKGWEVTEINAREVTVQQRGVSRKLTFEYASSWAAPEAAIPTEDGMPAESLEPDLSVLSTGGR